MEVLEIGSKVERCNSPANTLIKDGVQGLIVEVLQCANGELGYFVRVEAGASLPSSARVPGSALSVSAPPPARGPGA